MTRRFAIAIVVLMASVTVSSASSAAFGAGESGGEEGKDDDVGGVDSVEASDDVDEVEVFGRDGGNETAAALGDADADADDAALGVRYGCDERLRGWRHELYRGCQSRTRSGRTCQSWDRQWPHRHSRRKCHKGSCGNNYCRNPDGEPVNSDTAVLCLRSHQSMDATHQSL